MPKQKPPDINKKRRYVVKCAVKICKNQNVTFFCEKKEISLIKFHNFPTQNER